MCYDPVSRRGVSIASLQLIPFKLIVAIIVCSVRCGKQRQDVMMMARSGFRENLHAKILIVYMYPNACCVVLF